MDKFDKASLVRQRVLDYLNANPGVPLYVITWHMEAWDAKLTAARVSQILLRMEQLGEVRRTCAGVGMLKQPCAAWFANVEKTVEAQAVRLHVSKNFALAGQGRKVKRVREKRTIKTPSKVLFGGLLL